MEGFKEFQGKDLDDAIHQACDYFDVAREKLEIDIIQDSKSGIFGIVGARKALIKARRVQMHEASDVVASECDSKAPARQDAEEAVSSSGTGRHKGRSRQESQEGQSTSAKKPVPAKQVGSVSHEEDEEGESQTMFLDRLPEAPAYSDFPLDSRIGPRKSGQGGQRGRHGVFKQRERPSVAKQAKNMEHTGQELLFSKDFVDDGGTDGLQVLPLQELDTERLKTLALETVQRLASAVAGSVSCELHLVDSRVHVSIACEEDSGVLIGREGQTLAALQYLASRIVSRGMNAAVRVSLDAGDYRQRQDDKLRDLALNLAAKVKSAGRSCSTRPLSSYHRRIIHMTLQEDEQVQTRSTGEGALKRVVVQRRR